jgi:hypothetical protein
MWRPIFAMHEPQRSSGLHEPWGTEIFINLHYHDRPHGIINSLGAYILIFRFKLFHFQSCNVACLHSIE